MIEGNGIWDLLAGWLYSIDAADNLFPSIHCLVSWFCFLGIKDQKRIPTWYKRVSLVLAVLVFLSTIFTKQHVLVDVAGGVILAQVCFILGQKTKLWHIYERFGTKIEKKINSYTEGADTLNDAIQKYLGSNGELNGSVTEYVNGVNKVVKGVQDYTDGTNALFDVTWNSDELAKVDTKTAGKTFTVNGKVTVEGTTYDAVMNVEVLDASGLVQEVPEGSLGSVDFDANWQFYLATRTPKVADGGFAAAGVKDAGDYTTDEIVDPSFNDLGWRTVDVPHDFSIEGEKVKSSSDAQAYLEGGLGYYRKRFTVPASMSGNKTISLDFEGVYQNSVVYLNGEKIGSYPSGYTGFALDITKKVKWRRISLDSPPCLCYTMGAKCDSASNKPGKRIFADRKNKEG